MGTTMADLMPRKRGELREKRGFLFRSQVAVGHSLQAFIEFFCDEREVSLTFEDIGEQAYEFGRLLFIHTARFDGDSIS